MEGYGRGNGEGRVSAGDEIGERESSRVELVGGGGREYRNFGMGREVTGVEIMR